MTLSARLIVRLWLKGHNTAAIARMSNETEANVYNLFSQTREKLRKEGQSFKEFAKNKRPQSKVAKRIAFKKEETQERPCLKCQEPFNSSGKTNRVCIPCKESDEWF